MRKRIIIECSIEDDAPIIPADLDSLNHELSWAVGNLIYDIEYLTDVEIIVEDY